MGCSGCGNPPPTAPLLKVPCVVPYPCEAQAGKRGKFIAIVCYDPSYKPQLKALPKKAKKKAARRKAKK
jgi:hypothetical protein